MAKKTKKQKPKVRRPKGKSLSQSLRERDETKQELDRQLADESEGDAEDESEDGQAFEDDADDEDEESEDEESDDDDNDDLALLERPFGGGELATSDDDEEDGDEDDDEEYEDDDVDAAAQMGHQRYVMAGFFGLWIVVSYVLGRAFELAWSRFASTDWFVEHLPQLAAVPHEGELVSRATLSLLLGAVLAAVIVLRYYLKPDVRTWADEVAEELAHVKWPSRKEIGNHTVVVIVASSIITLYLWLLDQFWSFATNLIYQSGA